MWGFVDEGTVISLTLQCKEIIIDGGWCVSFKGFWYDENERKTTTGLQLRLQLYKTAG